MAHAPLDYPVTCPTCGHGWRSSSESGRTHCGGCLGRVYIPAAQRQRPPVGRQEPPDPVTGPVVAAGPQPGPGVVPGGAGEALAQAVGHLPTAAHRATFRLLVDAVVARHHLRQRHPSGWPSFVVGGPPKSAKTLLAVGACRAFGLDPAVAIRLAPRETEASLWGRRAQGPGGRWSLAASDVLAYPFLAVDELDKVAAPVVRSAYRLLQGDALVAGEGGQLVEVRPTALVIGNAAPAELVHEAYLRRSVVLDTSPLAGELGQVHLAARAFLAALPLLNLDALAPPAGDLPEVVADELAGALRAGLSKAGWRAVDERALALLALGRAATRFDTGLGGGTPHTLSGDLRAAAQAVAADYLDCAATVGEVAAPPGADLALPDAPARREAARASAEQEARRRAAARQDERDLAARVAAVIDELEGAQPDPDLMLPGNDRRQAVMVAAALDAMAGQVRAAASLGELDELLGEAGELVSQGRAWATLERHDEVPVPVPVDEPAWEVVDADLPDEDVEDGDTWDAAPDWLPGGAYLPAVVESGRATGPEVYPAMAMAMTAGSLASAIPGPTGVVASLVAGVAGWLAGRRVEQRLQEMAAPLPVAAPALPMPYGLPAAPASSRGGREHLDFPF